jgi:hypothetical protein
MGKESVLKNLNDDQELRPLIFEFIGRSMALGLSEMHVITNVRDRAKLHKDYYTSLQTLSEKLNQQIPVDEVDKAIVEVIRHYMRDGIAYFEYHSPWNN